MVKQRSRTCRQDFMRLIPKIFEELLRLANLAVSAPYFLLFQRGTCIPIRRILESQTDDDCRARLQEWCRYKTREAGYVQVAGAVMFTSIISGLSWAAVPTSHWSGPALWYASIVLAVCSILTGAQQTLVLESGESIADLTSLGIQDMRKSLTSRVRGPPKPSEYVLFSWQVPVMLLCYSVLCFLAGLCSVVYSPLSRKLQWNAESKTALMFSITAVVCLFSWAVASLVVFRLGIPGHLMTDSKWGSASA